MIREEVVRDKVVFYCDKYRCVVGGYLGMTFRQAVEHAEEHIEQKVV